MLKTGLLVTAVVLAAAGCSSGPSAPAPEPPASSTPAVPPPAPAPSPTVPACPSGAYLVTAVEGRGAASAIGRGTGGSIAATFTDGRFVLSSDGSQPVRLDVGPTTAELRFDGRISGTYAGDAAGLRLTTTEAAGEATVRGLGITRRASAGQLLPPETTAQAVCDDAAGTADLVLPDVRLTLTRQG